LGKPHTVLFQPLELIMCISANSIETTLTSLG